MINLRTAEDRGDGVGTSSPEVAADPDGVTQTDEDWAVYLTPRYERRGAFFVEAGEVPNATIIAHIPDWSPADHEQAWLADDLLLIPMTVPEGALTGLLSVDCPRSGLRPTDTELDALVAAAQHAGSALALTRRTADRGSR